MDFFFFKDTATTEIYTLSLHDALPILSLRKDATDLPSDQVAVIGTAADLEVPAGAPQYCTSGPAAAVTGETDPRSEEHTSELQSRQYLVCRLLLEKKTRPSKSGARDLL